MSEIGAGADVRMTRFDGIQNVGHLVVAGARSVVVNRDADIEFGHQLIEAVEGILGWIGRDVRSPAALANSNQRRLAAWSRLKGLTT